MDELDRMRQRIAELEGSGSKDGTKEDEKHIRDLVFLSRTAMGFLELPPEDNIYEFIAGQLKKLGGNSIIVVNSFDEATDCICCRAVLGLGEKMGAIASILGKHPVGMLLKIDNEARLGLTSGKLVKVPGGLYEFFFRKIPRTACHTIEKLLDLGDIYAMGFAWKGKLFGHASIVTRKETQLADQTVIETFIYQASVALQQRWTEQALRKAHDELEIRVEERTRELAEANAQLRAEITERKRAEQVLQQTEEKLGTILENTNDVIFQLSPLGKILYVSPKAVELYGYKPGDLIGKHLKKTTPISELPEALKVLKSVLSGKVITHFEINQRKANGNIIPVEINAVPVRKEGKIIAAEGVIRNITERKLAEEKIKRAAEEWRTTFDSITDLVFICDKDFRLIRVNKAFAGVFKKKPAELIGKPCYEIVHGTNESVPNCLHKKTIKTKKPATAEFFEPHLGMYLEASTSPIFNEKGEVVASVHLIKDITKRKKMEGQLIITDRLASIGELSSGIAHEINNPLAGIITLSELVLGKDLPDDVKKDIVVINREAERTAGVVRNLLTFARKHETEKTLVNINGIIEQVLELRAYEQKVNNFEVNTQFAPDLPEVIADGFQLQQVFINIIINAEHFTAEAHRRGTLTITTERVDDIIRASFTDDGPGIAKENLGHLFDPFFTTKEVGTGTGLGLSICHGIITEHGGRIYTKSGLGKGATFIVELPISKCSPANHEGA